MQKLDSTEDPGLARDRIFRRRFVRLAGLAAVLALLHFVDHAIRGELIAEGHLNPIWNHSGWPFDDHTDKPYVYPMSFVVVFSLLLGGMWFTVRGRLGAAYWLVTSLVLIAFLLFVHFIGFSAGAAETPGVIVMTHHNGVRAVAALVVVFGLVAVLLALAWQATRARRLSGHW